MATDFHRIWNAAISNAAVAMVEGAAGERQFSDEAVLGVRQRFFRG
jgi:hypothetical protein